MPASRGVSIVLFNVDRLLVVERGRPPYAGYWSFPGGRTEPGEDAGTAVLRELREETGLSAQIETHLLAHDVDLPDGTTLRLDVFLGRDPHGLLGAGGDAVSARWIAPDAIGSLRLTPGADAVIAAARAWRQTASTAPDFGANTGP